MDFFLKWEEFIPKVLPIMETKIKDPSLKDSLKWIINNKECKLRPIY